MGSSSKTNFLALELLEVPGSRTCLFLSRYTCIHTLYLLKLVELERNNYFVYVTDFVATTQHGEQAEIENR